jgi:hypothetical protein
MYNSKDDEEIRKDMEEDRARITQKMIAEKNDGAPVRPVKSRRPKLWDCEDMEYDGDYLNDNENNEEE